MTIFSWRLRRGIPLIQKFLSTESATIPNFLAASRAFRNPSAANSEWFYSPIRQFLRHSHLTNVTFQRFPTRQFLRHSHLTNVTFQRYGFSSSASSESRDTATNQSGDGDIESTHKNSDSTAPEQMQDGGFNLDSQHSESQPIKKRRRRSAKRIQFSDSDTERDLSIDDLVKLVGEKEELLKLKHKEIEKMQDKVLRSYAEMENVLDRTKCEAENAKKFAVQSFAKDLLDVADNLGRASSVVKDSFSKIDSSKDAVRAVPLLKSLLEGVEMTEKQLTEVFKKFGVQKFDPRNEQFDPNRHHAVFQITDASKPAGTVAAVLKSGYMLYDRVLRPAEVGVTDATSNDS